MTVLKPCCSCGVSKPLFDFAKDKHKKDGHHTKCKPCVKQYKADNKDAISEQRRSYREKNKEQIAEYMSEYRPAYREKNKAKLSLKSTEWARINSERAKSIRAESRKKHAETSRSITRNRRARIRNSTGVHKPSDIKKIMEMQRGKCACCKNDVKKKYHVDHIEAIANGGSNDPLNLQILCPTCNISKGARNPVEFMQSRGYLC